MSSEQAAPRVASPEHHPSLFGRFARAVAQWSGHPVGFGAAVAVVAVWASSGPVFGFSDTWQLVINTGTTVVTFLMVFVIQHTQNRDAIAMHLKLDEIIRSVAEAQNAFLDLEDLEEGDLERIRRRYEALARAARQPGSGAALAAPGAPPPHEAVTSSNGPLAPDA